MSLKELERINEEIVNCRKCPRLVEYRERIAKEKVRRFKNWKYWGKPITSFGNVHARLVLIGLAPAAHGGNRTGRIFTGDSSGDWVFKALYEVGLANKPKSISRDDGLEVYKTFITAALKCVPPKNRPTREELENCSKFLRRELDLLKNAKVVIVLGRIAFDSYLRYLKSRGYQVNFKFKHFGIYKFNKITLITSYHPSRQNTQTGKLKWNDWLKVFKEAKRIILET
jgi:uracil-DNA glycosylase family 4